MLQSYKKNLKKKSEKDLHFQKWSGSQEMVLGEKTEYKIVYIVSAFCLRGRNKTIHTYVFISVKTHIERINQKQNNRGGEGRKYRERSRGNRN